MDEDLKRLLEFPAMKDVAAPDNVTVEIDLRRGVVYVHVDGVTLFRACSVKEVVTDVKLHGEQKIVTNWKTLLPPEEAFR